MSLVVLVGSACSSPEAPSDQNTDTASSDQGSASDVAARLNKYTEVTLETDLPLDDTQRQVIQHLMAAAEPMNTVFWQQAYGDRDALLESVSDDAQRRFIEINFGPWDRLDGNAPFIEGVGPKPAGANLYPPDISKEELEAAMKAEGGEALGDLYTLVRRDDEGSLSAVPYSKAFEAEFSAAAAKLREAADISQHAAFADYLRLRADALESDEYLESDLAWMAMKDNPIDVVIGPIETYEDQLFGYKAGAEAYVLVKDMEWSARLARYATVLPDLQRGLPVPDAYKAEMPGANADLNAYDVVFAAGEANTGSKTIAINLPNDERVQLEHGTRRLQLKNAMRAKFDKILAPIASVLIAEDQRNNVTFDAFFANTMFHEVAHGLGIKNTLDGTNTVRKALQEQASAIEEGKADVLGLYMVTQLSERGEELDAELEENFTTFVASIFRSIRFGAASAHGRANLLRYNFFAEAGAFTRDEETGTYRVDYEKIKEASNELSKRILTFQGDGDYEGVVAFVERYGAIGEQLEADLARLGEAGIPVDITFRQGPAVFAGD